MQTAQPKQSGKQNYRSKHTPKTTKSKHEDIDPPWLQQSTIVYIESSSDSEWLSQGDVIIEVKLSNMKYAVKFPVTINNNNTISLSDTGATISCMSKACFDKLLPKSIYSSNTHICSKCCKPATVLVLSGPLHALKNSLPNFNSSS